MPNRAKDPRLLEHLPPPTSIVGGSMLWQVYKPFEHTIGGNRRHIYKSPNRFPIAGVLVLTHGFGTRYKNFLLDRPTIEIWLKPDFAAAAHLKIPSPGRAQYLLVDSDTDLKEPARVPDPHRPHWYKHPGHIESGQRKHVNIERVKISTRFKGRLHPVYDEIRKLEDDPGFHIMIFDTGSIAISILARASKA
jgi:hypothetical protein